MDLIVIYCTVPNKKLAKDITKILMKHKKVTALPNEVGRFICWF